MLKDDEYGICPDCNVLVKYPFIFINFKDYEIENFNLNCHEKDKVAYLDYNKKKYIFYNFDIENLTIKEIKDKCERLLNFI